MQTLLTCSHPKPCQQHALEAFQNRDAHRAFPGMDGSGLLDGPSASSFSILECHNLGRDMLGIFYIFPGRCSKIDCKNI